MRSVMALLDRTSSPRLAAAPLVAGIITVLAVVSCSKKQETTTTGESGSTGGAKVHVDQIVLGRDMTAGRGAITVDNATFTPGDTVFAPVVLAAPVAAGQLVRRWKAAARTGAFAASQPLHPG